MTKKLDDVALSALLQGAHNDAMSADTGNKLTGDRQRAMRYYMGDVGTDIPSEDGRSSAVSTDVSDTIDGLMPALMEIFAGSDEVVQFEPVGPEDMKAAEQETDYVNHVFMQKNEGFLTLYSMIKDALLSKVGIVKVWWETDEREEEETYYDLDDAQYDYLRSMPGFEIVAHTEKDQPGDAGAA